MDEPDDVLVLKRPEAKEGGREEEAVKEVKKGRE